jgi:hypothetical protein
VAVRQPQLTAPAVAALVPSAPAAPAASSSKPQRYSTWHAQQDDEGVLKRQYSELRSRLETSPNISQQAGEFLGGSFEEELAIPPPGSPRTSPRADGASPPQAAVSPQQGPSSPPPAERAAPPTGEMWL